MKLHRTTTLLLCLLIQISFGISILGQSTSNSPLKMNRRNPDGWFSLLVPKGMGKVERFVDSDGGFYIADGLEIHFDYWTYENTPNWLRGNYAKSLILACPEKSKHTRTLQTRVDRKRAVIQRCSKTDEGKGFRYIYYVTFPKQKVFNGEDFHYGMFNLRVKYKNPNHLSVAEEIVRSIDFEK